MKVRKKPVEVEAVRNDGHWETIIRWLSLLQKNNQPFLFAVGDVPPITRNKDGSLNIVTLEGTMRAEIGDWVIQGIQGEFYPCKPEIFRKTYEEIPE